MYFTVTATNGDFPHVGTILAETSEELNLKLALALCEHFNSEVTPPNITLDQCEYGKTFEINVINPDDDVNSQQEIYIEKTWLF